MRQRLLNLALLPVRLLVARVILPLATLADEALTEVEDARVPDPYLTPKQQIRQIQTGWPCTSEEHLDARASARQCVCDAIGGTRC